MRKSETVSKRERTLEQMLSDPQQDDGQAGRLPRRAGSPAELLRAGTAGSDCDAMFIAPQPSRQNEPRQPELLLLPAA